jgi:hypothetical protein
MVIYAMALPDRYGIACGAYAFTLIVTLASQRRSLDPTACIERLGNLPWPGRSAWSPRLSFCRFAQQSKNNV